MTDDRNRDLVMGRIRAALAGTRTTAVTEPAGAARTVRSFNRDLLSTFSAAALASGTTVSRVAAPEDAIGELASFLRAAVGDCATKEQVTVAFSPDAAGFASKMGEPLLDPPFTVMTRWGRTEEGRGAIAGADAGVTLATCAIADTGTVVLIASSDQHRLDSLLPPIHVVLLRARDIVPSLPDALARLSREQRFIKHSAVTFVTGPSRTADVELILTVGVHGPGRVHAIVIGG